jgi:hypothetical protein
MRYLFVLLMLSGCATTTKIAPYGKGSYIVTIADPSATTAVTALQRRAAEEAIAHCAKSGKEMSAKDSSTAGTHMWSTTSATLVFGCVE